MEGYPFFWSLDDMATLLLCFLTMGCQIWTASWIMDLDHAYTFFNQAFNFRVFELNAIVCALRYLCVSFKLITDLSTILLDSAQFLTF